MIDFANFYQLIAKNRLSHWLHTLPTQLHAWQHDNQHGDLPRWNRALNKLPQVTPGHIELHSRVEIGSAESLGEGERKKVESLLRHFMPWRKGPFTVHGIHIDTEWRSDWKWSRVAPHLDLAGKRILDVGCGNGYYMWRMLGAGAEAVVGVDPNWLFLNQFLAVKNYLPDAAAWHLPLALEELPAKLEGFDTVFSMGVLYHRRSPIDHLLDLKDTLLRGGELVLETLVVEGDAQQVLVPEDRYAMMRNVWFLPSVPALELWLRRAGFVDVRCVDVSTTSVAEQRATDWMRFQSLPDFLDPADHSRTVEGLPAPTRAVLLARKP